MTGITEPDPHTEGLRFLHAIGKSGLVRAYRSWIASPTPNGPETQDRVVHQ